MNRQRVLHFLWSGNVGGAERAVYQLVKNAVERGGNESVGVVFGQAQGPYYSALASLGCRVIDLHMRNTADLPRALRAVQSMRDFDIHHFHVLEPSMMITSVKCLSVARVFTQRHGVHVAPDPLKKSVRRLVGGRLLRRRFHAMSGNTLHATRYAIQRYGLGHLPYCVTYNGLDFSLLAPIRGRVQIRNTIGVGPTDLVVASSGNLKSLKRFNRLVDLLSIAANIHVLLVGDGPLRERLESQADTMGAGSRLHITGIVNNVADFLTAIDIFVLPSTADESFGNAVVEAMALGIPSIVFSDSPGICEHIEDGLTGFVVDDMDQLVRTVRALGADSDLRTRVGQAGSSHVRSKYTLDGMNDAYEQLYRAAVTYRDSRPTRKPAILR